MVEKFKVEKSGVDMSFKLIVKGYLNPGLFNPMVQKFMVEKFMIEKSGVENHNLPLFKERGNPWNEAFLMEMF